MYETYRVIHRLAVAPPSTYIHWPCDNIARGVTIMAQIKREGRLPKQKRSKYTSIWFMFAVVEPKPIRIFIYFDLNYHEINAILGKAYIIESTLCYAGVN